MPDPNEPEAPDGAREPRLDDSVEPVTCAHEGEAEIVLMDEAASTDPNQASIRRMRGQLVAKLFSTEHDLGAWRFLPATN